MMWRRRSPSTRGCGASSAPLCRLPAGSLLAPGSEREAEAADQAVSLALAFLDRHVPEGVAAGVPR